jgi:DNA-binding GntR family transcriptional regulator
MLKTGNGHAPLPAARPPSGGAQSRRKAPPPDGTIAMLQTHSLPGLVQRELERMILAGDLAAGAKLNEVAVAELLGVSRGPVREAFRALEESGLVRLEKNRGVFVRQISLEEAAEIYELRATFDQLAGRKLAAAVTPGQLKELRLLLERMEKAAARSDLDAYHPLNLQFHDAPAAAVVPLGNRKATHRKSKSA